MRPNYKERRQRLDAALERALGCGRSTDMWPRWVEPHKDKGNWNSLVLDLHQECEEQSGVITKYFVDKFTEIAEKAILVINDIEG